MNRQDITRDALIRAVADRHSVRSYDRSRRADIGALTAWIAADRTQFDSAQVTIAPVRAVTSDFGASYGVICGTSDYLALIVGDRADDATLAAAGYRMERAILAATAMGMATCWVGGTFRAGAFEGATLTPGAKIKAVVALGYAAERRSLIDRMFRAAVHATRRRPFEQLFFEGDLSRPYPADGPLARAFSLVRLAPSAANRQPWRMIASTESAAVSLYMESDPGFQMIDAGIAMAHFDLGAPRDGVWAFEEGAASARPRLIARRTL